MDDRPDKLAQDEDRGASEIAETSRRAYAAPLLIEYGSVAKLTQSGNGSFADAGGMMMMMSCL